MMHYWNNGWETAGAVWMSVMMLVFWGAVAWVVVTLVRRSRTDSTEISDHPDPLRTLDRRYANGDIDTDEYTARRKTLTQQAVTNVGRLDG